MIPTPTLDRKLHVILVVAVIKPCAIATKLYYATTVTRGFTKIVSECLLKCTTNLPVKTNNFSWICCSCGMPNFSSALFDTDLSKISTSNQYSYLDTTLYSDIGSPIAASSPKAFRTNWVPKIVKHPLKSLVINCQSLRSKNKQAELHAVLESVKPDVVFGNESWLDGNILNSEVFPENFTVYRKDRASDPHGGVFLLVDSSLISSEETSLDVEGAELIWAKISTAGSKDLLLGSFYRPPSPPTVHI